MATLIENIWNMLNDEFKKYRQNPSFGFDETKQEDFKSIFNDRYDKIMADYMNPSVEQLDRHKVAAIIIISLLEADVISYESLDEGFLFIGAELLALKVGLAYMIEKLNEKLKSRGEEREIKEFIFPEAQSCKTSYINIMCRNLYFAKRDYVFNPLDLADRLFLVEYIALSKKGIDPDILKDY